MTEGSVIICTDGSDLAIDALRVGLTVVGGDTTPILTTVVAPLDWGALHGTGHAGALLDDADYESTMEALEREGHDALESTAQRLDLPTAERCFLWGDAGPEICRLAADRGAKAIVIGTRGRGGLRRALLGSVSDHVVRNASSPVVVCRPPETAG